MNPAAVGIEAEWQRLPPRTVALFEAEAKRRAACLRLHGRPEAFVEKITGLYLFTLVRRWGYCDRTGAVPFEYAMAGALPAPHVGHVRPTSRLYFEAERVFW